MENFRRNTVEFLTIDYNSGINFSVDDLILSTSESPAVTSGTPTGSGRAVPRHTARTLKSNRWQHPSTAVGTGVYELSSNVRVTSVQFTEPFAYSSSNWVNSDRGMSCRKNISKFIQMKGTPSDTAPPTAMVGYRGSDGFKTSESVDEMEVNVVVKNLHEPFEYLLKSVDSPAYMRLTIPGN